MPEAFVMAAAAGGRALARPVDGAAWVSPERVQAFAEQHRRELRYLNRGSVVTAALIDAVRAQRWPDPADRPGGLALVVGSAFGNQGETTRYFRSFAGGGPQAVSPMASYDVAINAFVNFCSIFFKCSGVVQTFSSGAVSGTDALAAGLSLLESGDGSAVIIVGVEHESLEADAYCGAPHDAAGGAESGVALLLEPSAAGAATRGRVVAAETAFAPPGRGCTEMVLGRLVERMLSQAGVPRAAIAVVTAEPSWTDAGAVARRALALPGARWIESTGLGGRRQIGSAGLIGSALVLAALTDQTAWGLSVVADPLGWVGAALLAGTECARDARRRPEEGPACPR
jgi:Beta-ketoacyl synthase, N-terminal domain